mmetsp:Transcript_91985/g.269053  ORF Transcript_91985/g.269053 Transcript_91985/m.269053 type:complete len:233 (-) Transcript_91985:762-1460(-)
MAIVHCWVQEEHIRGGLVSLPPDEVHSVEEVVQGRRLYLVLVGVRAQDVHEGALAGLGAVAQNPPQRAELRAIRRVHVHAVDVAAPAARVQAERGVVVHARARAADVLRPALVAEGPEREVHVRELQRAALHVLEHLDHPRDRSRVRRLEPPAARPLDGGPAVEVRRLRREAQALEGVAGPNGEAQAPGARRQGVQHLERELAAGSRQGLRPQQVKNPGLAVQVLVRRWRDV